MADVTWLGDEDPGVQSIEQYGHTFVKGVPTSVPDKDPKMAKFKDSALFEVAGESAPEPKTPKAPRKARANRPAKPKAPKPAEAPAQ